MLTTRVTIGDLDIDRVTQHEALCAVDALIRAGRGGFVVTPNIDHIVQARRDGRLRQAYSRASLSLADGQPLLWMARALGAPLPEKVSGSDFIAPLMAYAASNLRRVFFFGATPQVSAEAERRLVGRYPPLQVVGRDCSNWCPGVTESPYGSDVVRRIRDCGADLVVVALGSPKQEKWMAQYERVLAPAVAIGVGGSLDFVAGAVRRAPRWMSGAGLEWLFRLSQDPRRLAYRYLVRDMDILAIFAGDLYRTAVRRQQAIPSTGREARF